MSDCDQTNEEQGETYGSKRIASGVQRLDYILKGGFLQGGVYGVVGVPGSGKTILGNQTCFNHVLLKQGQCIYMTLLAESHARMLTHLKTLNFFDSSYIPEKIFYVSGYNILDKEGVGGLLKFVVKAVQDHKTNLLVMDGMENAVERSGSGQILKKYIHDLQASMGLLHCTTLLLSTATSVVAPNTEYPLLEGIIELSYRLVGPRAVRELTVHKFRGTDYLLGKHEVEISKNGMTIHPRTEIQFAYDNSDSLDSSDGAEALKMKFGINRLDEMLHGGVSKSSTTTLLGAPGAGKTVLGLAFLVEGAKQGQCGTYFGFYEPPFKLIQKAEAIGIPLNKYVKEGLVEILWQTPLEHFMDSLAEQVLERFRAKKSPNRRLFIDGIEGFRQAAVYPERMRRFIAAFINQLRMQDVTTLISSELPLFKSELDILGPEVTSVVDNIILLKYVELRSQIYRLISIMKMRESDYSSEIREFKISSKGVEVASLFDTDGSILSGAAGLIRGDKLRKVGDG